MILPFYKDRDDREHALTILTVLVDLTPYHSRFHI